jgi:hypothetical protein
MLVRAGAQSLSPGMDARALGHDELSRSRQKQPGLAEKLFHGLILGPELAQ